MSIRTKVTINLMIYVMIASMMLFNELIMRYRDEIRLLTNIPVP